MVTDLNRVFDGKDPAYMDRLFPEGGWRKKLRESNARRRDWGWFWCRFAPNGMLISEDPPDIRVKSFGDMPPALLKAVALGFLESENPVAEFRNSRGHVLRYWPLLRGNAPDDLLAYSDAVAFVESDEEE